jgi:hypothetical protein
MENAEQTYPNRLSAWEFINAQGWKISRGRFYQHADEKKVRPNREGKYNQKDLIRYAKRYLKKMDGSTSSEETEQLQQAKADAEARKLRAQAEHWEIKTKALSGQYVDKEWFERELAARAAVFRSDIENFIRSEASAMITIAAGDPARAPDLTDHMMKRVEEWLARYSEGRKFEAPMPALDEEEEKEYLEDDE